MKVLKWQKDLGAQQPHLILSELDFRAHLGRQALLVGVNQVPGEN